MRIALLRSTIHLVTDRDCLALRPVLQPYIERHFHTGTPFGRQVRGVDTTRLVTAARALLDEKPRAIAELGKLLQKQWPDRDAISLAYAIRELVPLVQVPPRGVWGASGQSRCATAEHWLGRPLEPNPSSEKMVRRYLAAFGPSTVSDVQAWSGPNLRRSSPVASWLMASSPQPGRSSGGRVAPPSSSKRSSPCGNQTARRWGRRGCGCSPSLHPTPPAMTSSSRGLTER